MSTDHQEMFARLLTLSKINEARIKANPVKYLSEMTERFVVMHMAVKQAIDELDGFHEFFEDEQLSIRDRAYKRNRDARKTLQDALDKLNIVGKYDTKRTVRTTQG